MELRRAMPRRRFGGLSIAKYLRPALTLVACVALPGCTLIGAGIGSAQPRWESEGDVEAPQRDLYGNEVRLETRERHVRGTFVGLGDETVGGKRVRVIVLDTSEGQQRIPLSDASQVEVKTGSFVVEGALIGAVIDVVLVVAVVSVASDPLAGANLSLGTFE